MPSSRNPYIYDLLHSDCGYATYSSQSAVTVTVSVTSAVQPTSQAQLQSRCTSLEQSEQPLHSYLDYCSFYVFSRLFAATSAVTVAISVTADITAAICRRSRSIGLQLCLYASKHDIWSLRKFYRCIQDHSTKYSKSATTDQYSDSRVAHISFPIIILSEKRPISR